METQSYLDDIMFELPAILATQDDAVETLPAINTWDPRLVIDMAIGIDDIPTLLLRYNLDPREFDLLAASPVFRRELALTIRDVRENGVPFSKKAAVQAETYLEVLDEIVRDAATPASTRLEAIRSVVKWGKLEPKESKDDGTKATQINVQINF